MYEIAVYPKELYGEIDWKEITDALSAEGVMSFDMRDDLTEDRESIWVYPKSVYQAVTILNRLGYETDEDEVTEFDEGG